MKQQVGFAKSISPRAVLTEIAEAIPKECKENMIIIGSLAVGYYYFVGNETMVVRTKDADCLLSPRIEAVHAAEAITEKLFDSGWSLFKSGEWTKPGNENTPLLQLPAVRLNPPGNTDWFIELLTVPESPSDLGNQWISLKTKYGCFGIPSFGFLSLTNYEPLETELGLCIARPEMMALANMLEHSEIKPETMSGLIQGREIKRSNKDLGRVLAITYLSTGQNVDSLEKWNEAWQKALKNRFPENWKDLARGIGSGLQELLQSPLDIDEAYHTCRYGLLASHPPSLAQLRIAGERLLQDTIKPIEGIVKKLSKWI